jgi:hypothetical protein
MYGRMDAAQRLPLRVWIEGLRTTISSPGTDLDFRSAVRGSKLVRKAHARTDESTTRTGARGVSVGTWLVFGFGGVRSGGCGSALSVRQFEGVVRYVGEVRFSGAGLWWRSSGEVLVRWTGCAASDMPAVADNPPTTGSSVG